MTAQAVGDLHVNVCPACAGIWFDLGQFGRMVKEGAIAIDNVERLEPPEIHPAPHAQPGNCPSCRNPLHRYHYAGTSSIEIDGCYECGGIFVTPQALHDLEARTQNVPGMTGPSADPRVAAAVSQLDSMARADMMRATLTTTALSCLDHTLYRRHRYWLF